MTDEDIRNLHVGGWPLPDEYLLEIGRVAAVWASLDSFLTFCIGKLAGFNELNDPKPFILINHSSVSQRLDMFGALCEHLVGEFPKLKPYPEVVAKLREAQRLRNTYLHHGIALNEDTGNYEIGIGSARGKLKASVEKVSLVDVRRAWIATHEAQLALYKLVLGIDQSPVWTHRDAEH